MMKQGESYDTKEEAKHSNAYSIDNFDRYVFDCL